MMDFCYALNALREGKKVERSGWNGKGIFLFLNPGSQITVSVGRPLAAALEIGTACEMLPYIMMKTAAPGVVLVPWLASQTDILADDWSIKEGV
jgi:hypothetical protein